MNATKIRKKAGSLAVEALFRGLSGAARVSPKAQKALRSVRRIRNVPYRKTGDPSHTLDIYLPKGPGPYPTVFYIHGGGFRILSKDTHWALALAFARRGYAVFNINYRLAGKAPFPAAFEDTCHAFDWLVRNAENYDADLSQLVFAGESAGANLATSLALATSWKRHESYSDLVFPHNLQPKAVIAACGMMHVSDITRFHRRKPHLPIWLRDRMEEVCSGYVPELYGEPFEGTDHNEEAVRAEIIATHAFAEPLLVLESDHTFERPLMPFFAPVGTKDPIMDDTRRLGAALEARGIRCDVEIYPGEVHAFHAFTWREAARDCWRKTFAFLDDVFPRSLQ